MINETSEYIQLRQPEMVYGQKNLLESQLGMLSVSKRFKEYQKLRRDDLVLRIALKNKIEETAKLLDELDKMLPKTKPSYQKPIIPGLALKKGKTSLEQEIDFIRAKLAKLK